MVLYNLKHAAAFAFLRLGMRILSAQRRDAQCIAHLDKH